MASAGGKKKTLISRISDRGSLKRRGGRKPSQAFKNEGHNRTREHGAKSSRATKGRRAFRYYKSGATEGAGQKKTFYVGKGRGEQTS